MKKKIVINTQEAVKPDLENSNEAIEKDLDYFRELYPEGDPLFVCKLYRCTMNEFRNIKRMFLDEFNNIPNEKEIAERFGGGDFEIFLMKREGSKGGLVLHTKAKFSIDKVWTKTEKEQIQPGLNEKQLENSTIKDKLEELKMMKEVMFNGDQGNNAIMQMMFNTQTTLMTMILEMSKNNGKSDNKLLETILPTLLSKSLEKQNVISDIENIAKLKEIFPSGDSGTDWGSIIGNTLPMLLPLLTQGNSKANIPQRNIPVNQQAGDTKALLKGIVKEAIIEYDQENAKDEATEDEELLETENIEKENNIIELNSGSQKEEISNLNKEEINMNIKSQVALIKNSPRNAQNGILKTWCTLKPIKEVMSFCIDTELLKDKEEFIERCNEAGIDISGLD